MVREERKVQRGCVGSEVGGDGGKEWGPHWGWTLDLVVRPGVWNHFWVTASFENLMDAKERMHTHTQTHACAVTHTFCLLCQGFLEPRKLIQRLRIKNLWPKLVHRDLSEKNPNAALRAGECLCLLAWKTFREVCQFGT